MKRRALFLIVLFVTALTAWFIFTKILQKEPESVREQPSVNNTSTINEAEGRYLFSGTIVVARAVELLAVDANGNKDYSQPFSKLDTFNPDQYDAWAADFECPITDANVPYRTQIDSLVFNCRPEFLPELTRYISLFNLANNHTSDQSGEVGLRSTRTYLEEAGVQYFGNFDPTVTSDSCEVIGLPVRIKDANEKQLLPIGFCSWHYFNDNREPTDEELALAREYATVMPVFAFVEMGTEYQAEAGVQQQRIAHSIIDTGAEFVFANNPHWVQNSEVYNGKLIVYSLGNFIFDQIEPETQRGVSIDTTMIVKDKELDAWLELGRTCQPEMYKDKCFEEAKNKGLRKLDIELSYDAVANTSGYRRVTEKADSQTQQAIKDRLRWDAAMEALKKASENN